MEKFQQVVKEGGGGQIKINIISLSTRNGLSPQSLQIIKALTETQQNICKATH